MNTLLKSVHVELAPRSVACYHRGKWNHLINIGQTMSNVRSRAGRYGGHCLSVLEQPSNSDLDDLPILVPSRGFMVPVGKGVTLVGWLNRCLI